MYVVRLKENENRGLIVNVTKADIEHWITLESSRCVGLTWEGCGGIVKWCIKIGKLKDVCVILCNCIIRSQCNNFQ